MPVLPVDALLEAESGYAPVNPPEWIARLCLGVALLSVYAGNHRGLLDAETLQALVGYNMLRTDQNGWIEITTDLGGGRTGGVVVVGAGGEGKKSNVS